MCSRSATRAPPAVARAPTPHPASRGREATRTEASSAAASRPPSMVSVSSARSARIAPEVPEEVDTLRVTRVDPTAAVTVEGDLADDDDRGSVIVVSNEAGYNEYDQGQLLDLAPSNMEALNDSWTPSPYVIVFDVKGEEGKPETDERFQVESPSYLLSKRSRAIVQFSNHLRDDILRERARSRSPPPTRKWVAPHAFPSGPDNAFDFHVMSIAPQEGEPWHYPCAWCRKTYGPTDRVVALTPELEEKDPQDRGMWGKCCGNFLSTQIGRSRNPVRDVSSWRAARTRHLAARSSGSNPADGEASLVYPLNWKLRSPMLHPLYAFAPPGSLRQHLRFNRECRILVQEDFYRHQCTGYGSTKAPNKSWKPADGDAPAQTAPTAKEAFGDRGSTTMAQVATITELSTDQRKSNWRKIKNDSTTSAGISFADNDARQVERDESTVKAAKRFAEQSVEWYAQNPQWVPAFNYASPKEVAEGDSADSSSFKPAAKRSSWADSSPCASALPDAPKPEVKRYVFPPFHSGIRTDTCTPWRISRLTDNALFRALADKAVADYIERRRRPGQEKEEEEKSVAWVGPPQEIAGRPQLAPSCLSEMPFRLRNLRRHPNPAATAQPSHPGQDRLRIDLAAAAPLPALTVVPTDLMPQPDPATPLERSFAPESSPDECLLNLLLLPGTSLYYAMEHQPGIVRELVICHRLRPELRGVYWLRPDRSLKRLPRTVLRSNVFRRVKVVKSEDLRRTFGPDGKPRGKLHDTVAYLRCKRRLDAEARAAASPADADASGDASMVRGDPRTSL